MGAHTSDGRKEQRLFHVGRQRLDLNQEEVTDPREQDPACNAAFQTERGEIKQSN